MIKRVLPLLLLCGFLSGCMLGWKSSVDVLRLQPVRSVEIVVVVNGIEGVSIVSLPPSHFPEGGIVERINVKRRNVIAFYQFSHARGSQASIYNGHWHRLAVGRRQSFRKGSR